MEHSLLWQKMNRRAKFIIRQRMKVKLLLTLFLMSMITVGHTQDSISKVYERNVYEQIDSLSSMSIMDTTQNPDTLQQTPHKKSPALGVLFSILYPGAGQLYLGQHKGRGIAMFTISSVYYLCWIGGLATANSYNYDDTFNPWMFSIVLLSPVYVLTFLWSFVDIIISANSLANQQHEALTWNLDKHKKSKLSITPNIFTSNLTKTKTPAYGLSLRLNF